MKKFKPFSKNIIFFDTEFSLLDPCDGEMLSIGMIKLKGDELYLELEYKGAVSEFAKKNVLPNLNGNKITHDEARFEILKFVGKREPRLISYITTFDLALMRRLFSRDAWPFYWIPVDFSSVMFGMGINPDDFDSREFLDSLGINLSDYRRHHAMDDAKLLRDVYLKLSE